MHIAVIGAGSIGGAVIRQFIDAGHDVTVVARNKRLLQLQQKGLQTVARSFFPWRVGHSKTQSIRVVETLDAHMPFDVIVATVQRHHMDAVIKMLKPHPCQCIVFMCNYGASFEAVTSSLGERVYWCFPSMLAGMDAKTGVSTHLIFPRILKGLQITTIGPAFTVDAVRQHTQQKALHMLLGVFNRAGISSDLCMHMDDWLKTHAALMLPLIASGVRNLQQSRSMHLNWQDCWQAAGAIRCLFALLRQCQIRPQPFNMRLFYYFVPRITLACSLFLAFRFGFAASSLFNHAEHAVGEAALLTADFEALAVPIGFDLAPLYAISGQ